MIGALQGTVLDKNENSLLLQVGGVGFRVFVSPLLTADLNSGEELSLRTHLVVREDELSLFGFQQQAELDFFRLLLSVSGIGPKAALNILSYLTLDNILAALSREDHTVFTTAPGVGPKMARKIVLELKDKAARKFTMAEQPTPISGGVSSAGQAAREAAEALLALGYTTAVAEQAVKEAAVLLPEAAGDSGQLIRQALKGLARE